MTNSILSPRLRFVALFIVVYFLAGIGLAVSLKNYEFIFYEAEMAVLMLVVLYMDGRVKFSPLVLWGLAFWGLAHLSGGLLPIPASVADPGGSLVLYNMKPAPWFPKYDQLVHAFGFGVSTIAAHEALQAHLRQKLPVNLAMGAALFFIALGLGSLNEIIEFAAVEVMPHTNVGGYFNTGWDMVSNGTGSLLAVLYLKIFRKI